MAKETFPQRKTKAALQKEIDALKVKYHDLESKGLGEREQVMLRTLEHFYVRVVNLQCHCEKDRAHLDKVLEDLQFIKPKAKEKK